MAVPAVLASVSRSAVLAVVGCAGVFTAVAPAQEISQGVIPPAAGRSSQLTLYNGDVAVVRTTVPLTLRPGLNTVQTNAVTRELEPDSVVLRDPTGRLPFAVVEQTYDAAVVSQDDLLRRFEGQEILFATGGLDSEGKPRLVRGRIRRAPGTPESQGNGAASTQPLIEVDGRLQFSLPGLPLFPASTDGLLLKPTLHWQINAPRAAQGIAELAYVTRGMHWSATYNVVSGEDFTGNPGSKILGAQNSALASLTAWVTLDNHSGTDFPAASIKLMAGDVQTLPAAATRGGPMYAKAFLTQAIEAPTEKAFDDLHLYDLHRTTSLLDGATKQVQFLDTPSLTLTRTYRYDGAAPNTFLPSPEARILEGGFGLGDNRAVMAEVEFANTAGNHLGVPLPAGRLRLYRADTDGQLEFTGEAAIPHTPAGQPVHIAASAAFDLTGKRLQTAFRVGENNRSADESFAIHLTNAKPSPVTISVTEHLGRGDTWEITAHSASFSKTDAHTVSFPVEVPAHGETDFAYTVHYSWPAVETNR